MVDVEVLANKFEQELIELSEGSKEAHLPVEPGSHEKKWLIVATIGYGSGKMNAEPWSYRHDKPQQAHIMAHL